MSRPRGPSYSLSWQGKSAAIHSILTLQSLLTARVVGSWRLILRCQGKKKFLCSQAIHSIVILFLCPLLGIYCVTLWRWRLSHSGNLRCLGLRIAWNMRHRKAAAQKRGHICCIWQHRQGWLLLGWPTCHHMLRELDMGCRVQCLPCWILVWSFLSSLHFYSFPLHIGKTRDFTYLFFTGALG